MDKDRLIIYQINPSMFTHQGTLSAAKNLLPHIKSLGVNVVYLFAVCKADDSKDRRFWSPRQKQSHLNNPKNPYRIDDYYAIDEQYGGNKEFKEFIDAAHRSDLMIMMDLVYMHCGPHAKIIEECPEGIMRDENGNIEYTVYNFPKINFASRKLREYFIDNMQYYAREYGVDGFRCDVGDKVPLDFWQEAVNRVHQINENIIMLNEGSNPQYVLSGVFDLNYNFPAFMWNSQKFPDYFRMLKNEIDKKGISRKGIYFLENHDTVTDNGRADWRFSLTACDCAYVHIFTAPGTPLIYCGEEIADLNAHNMFANKEHNRGYGIEWSNALLPHGRRRLSLLKKLIKLRKKEDSLAVGDFRWLESNNDTLIYERFTNKEKITIYINWGNKEDLLVAGDILLSRGYNNGTLNKNGFVIAKTKI